MRAAANSAASLREVLRERTTLLHRRAETALDLMNPSLSAEQYFGVLRLFHALYSQLEPAIVAHPGWAVLGLDMSARNKLPLLEQDLAFMEERLPRKPAASSFSKQCGLLVPWLDTFAAVLGAAYVLEGSTLGGVIVHRHLSTVLGLDQGRGASFFSCYGSETGARWKEFLAALERTSLEADDMERAVSAAVRTFEYLAG
jgi:heme oxygenase